ncbi:hypothetical protein [Microbacterium sp. SS28]|uniref:hypothetical protein n=1 Tax=Microbacterium sp. SS28 TaxID=2919948 RepID=UPI001FA9ED96|nr:hypothetical protein [Microbacterium sp. SS28]
MNAPAPSDDERELAELRARAYGRHPDIDVDPAALDRLRELEAAHLGTSLDVADAERDEPDDGLASPSAEPPAEPPVESAQVAPPDTAPPRTRWSTAIGGRRGRLVAGASVTVLALAYTLSWLVGPHPDADLRPVADEPDGVVLSMLDFLGADGDPAEVRGYEAYGGLEPWFVVDAQGLHCFMIIQRPGSVDGANCVPPGVELFADITPWPTWRDDDGEALPDGSMIRFHYRGDRVEVFVYPSAAEG